MILLIVAGTAMRLVLAATLGLGIDESYTVAVARQAGLSYFDHPPLVFWIVHAVTRLTGSERAILVRLPFILLFAGTTWMVFRLGARLFGAYAGAWGAFALSVSPVFSVSAGGWVLPDGPLMFFMVGCALFASRALLEDPPGHPVREWLGAGLMMGLALLSKYHAVFLAFGLGLFLLTSAERRRWLRRPEPYLGVALAAAVFLPVILWNAGHDWASFRFQAGRGLPVRSGHLVPLLASLGGQAGYVFPWIWLPLLWVLVKGLAGVRRDAAGGLLSCLAVGPIAVFTLAAAVSGDAGLPHWETPGYLMLFPLLGAAVASRVDRGEVGTRWWLRGSVAVFIVVVLLGASQASTGWMSRLAPRLFRSGDPTLELLDWREIAPALARVAPRERPGPFIVATTWSQAGKIAYALGPDVTVLCWCAAPHHFAYLYDQARFLGRDAVLLERSRMAATADSLYAPYFDRIEPLGRIPIRRAGRVELTVSAYVGHRYAAPYPGNPHP